MVDQLRSFASEVTRVAREVGTEGKLGGQAEVERRAGHLEGPDRQREFHGRQPDLAGPQHRRSHHRGGQWRSCPRKSRSMSKARFCELKNTINTMVDQLSSFAAEVTRVAREVGTEGKLGRPGRRQRRGRHLEGSDRQREFHGRQPDRRRSATCRKSPPPSPTAILSKKITVDVKGEILELKNTINTMVDQLSSFAAEVTRVAREVGTEGKLGGQAEVTGVAGTWKDLTDTVNSMAGNLTVAGAQHRRSHHRRRQRRSVARKSPSMSKGEILRTEKHDQHDGGSARLVCVGSDARGARGGHRRQARRPGRGARRGRHLEGPDRFA